MTDFLNFLILMARHLFGVIVRLSSAPWATGFFECVKKYFEGKKYFQITERFHLYRRLMGIGENERAFLPVVIFVLSLAIAFLLPVISTDVPGRIVDFPGLCALFILARGLLAVAGLQRNLSGPFSGGQFAMVDVVRLSGAVLAMPVIYLVTGVFSGGGSTLFSASGAVAPAVLASAALLAVGDQSPVRNDHFSNYSSGDRALLLVSSDMIFMMWIILCIHNVIERMPISPGTYYFHQSVVVGISIAISMIAILSLMALMLLPSVPIIRRTRNMAGAAMLLAVMSMVFASVQTSAGLP